MKKIQLLTSIPSDPILRKGLNKCLQEAINAADPGYILQKFVTASDESIQIIDKKVGIQPDQQIILISVGKASMVMCKALQEQFGTQIKNGICVTKDLDPAICLSNRIEVIQSSHPTPGQNGILAAYKIKEMLDRAAPNAFVLCAISGGASSLVVHPADGISLSDYRQLTSILLQHEYSITEINTIRKHIDQFKGGGLLKWINGRRGVSLILSDVISNDLSVIASGPTVTDASTYHDAITILKSKGNWTETPESVRKVLHDGEEGKIPETLKEVGVPNGQYQNIIIGSLRQSVTAVIEAATSNGWETEEMLPPLSGSLDMICQRILQDIYSKGKRKNPCLLVYGGEGTVSIHGTGRGGRNSHLAWLLAPRIKDLPGVSIITFATDGDDGNSKAAGAIIDSSTCIRAEHKQLDLKYYGENADTASMFEALGDSLNTGATGTNVNDLVLVFLEKNA
jgi:glycerate 2-kinase